MTIAAGIGAGSIVERPIGVGQRLGASHRQRRTHRRTHGGVSEGLSYRIDDTECFHTIVSLLGLRGVDWVLGLAINGLSILFGTTEAWFRRNRRNKLGNPAQVRLT